MGRFLHPNGLFSVYYLGVYMFLGLMNLFIFSVSTTLKSYSIIIAYKIKNVNNIVLKNFLKPEKATYSVQFTLYKS